MDGWFQFCLAIEALASWHINRETIFYRYIDSELIPLSRVGQWDFARVPELSLRTGVRARYWQKFLYDRTRYLAGRRVGQSDLRGFYWGYPSDNGQRRTPY